MGAAPRYFGKSEACRLMLPSFGEIEHPLGNDASVADHNDGVRLESSKLGAEIFVVLDLIWLRDRQAKFCRALFDWRPGERKASAFGTIRPSNDQAHPKPCSDKLFQRGDGESVA